MCNLCSDDEEIKKVERENILYLANAMADFALNLKHIANGHIDPHGEKSKTMRKVSRHIIIKLVTEWM